MFDFLAAIGLFFAIEGILFAAFPLGTKRAMAQPSICRTDGFGSWASSRQSSVSSSCGWYDISSRASEREADGNGTPRNGSRGGGRLGEKSGLRKTCCGKTFRCSIQSEAIAQ
jgi:hypothetical protein